MELEPFFSPGTVFVCAFMPGTGMGRDDKTCVSYLIAGTEEGQFDHAEIEFPRFFFFDQVAGALETVIMIAEIDTFCSGIQFKAVHGGAGTGVAGDPAFVEKMFSLIGAFAIKEGAFAAGQIGPYSAAVF